MAPGTLQAWSPNASTPGMLKTLGVQLFSLPKSLEADLEGTLRLLSEMGYGEIELFGPYTFSAETNRKWWEQLTPMLGFSGSGFFGLTQDKFLELCRDNGLRIPSMHTG